MNDSWPEQLHHKSDFGAHITRLRHRSTYIIILLANARKKLKHSLDCDNLKIHLRFINANATVLQLDDD